MATKTVATAKTAAKPGPRVAGAAGVTVKSDAPADPNSRWMGEMASKEMSIEVVDVTPEIASHWLTFNSNNRPVRARRVVEFRRDMLAGNWRSVGDPVRFNTNGELIDGQHRLEAIILSAKVKADISIPLVVVRGVAPEDHVVIDTGTRRTAADQLRIAGYSNYAILAAAAKWIILWDRKALYSDAMLKSVTHAEIMEYVDQHKELRDICNMVGSGLGRKCDMPNGYIAAGWYILWRIDNQEADEFFGRFADGTGLYDGDPILALRNRLREVARNHGNLSGDMYLSLLFRTWNAKREDRTLKMIPIERAGTPIPAPNTLI